MVATISFLRQTFSYPFMMELHGSNNFILTSDILLSLYEGAPWWQQFHSYVRLSPLPLWRSFMVATISFLCQTFSYPFTMEFHGGNNFILTSDFLLCLFEGAPWYQQFHSFFSDNAPHCETVHATPERLSPFGVCQRQKRRGPRTSGERDEKGSNTNSKVA